MSARNTINALERYNASVLLVDVGNTRVTLGAGHGDRVRVVGEIPTAKADEQSVRRVVCSIKKKGFSPDGVSLSSVVPSQITLWKRIARKEMGLEVVTVNHKRNLGVRISYPHPESIGSDRLANATAAVQTYGCPVIVIDFGTAVTFDVVSARGAYIGGVIAPGLAMMSDYLAERTALLPRLEFKGRCSWIGKSTESAMRIGARIGYRGMVREILEHVLKSRQASGAALCATGGNARWALTGLGIPLTYDETLTLRGAYRIFLLNSSRWT